MSTIDDQTKTQEETEKAKEQEIGALHRKQHEGFILSHDTKVEEFEYWATEHLRVSGYYWGFSALRLLKAGEESLSEYVEKELVVPRVMACYDERSGGFGGNEGHDPHMLYTLSAVQVLLLYDALEGVLDVEKVVHFVASKQQPDGSFAGDEWGEIDTRFSYIALSCLSLLGRLDAVDVDKAVDFILRCQNFDGAFGVVPGTESHSGQTFCCIGALSIAKQLHRIDHDQLGWWLAERQLPEGGLNGRPQKLPDVCYSWWVLSALAVLNRLHWINKEKLMSWILACQDPDRGGFSDRPDCMPDIFHTFFGLAGLSLLGFPNLTPIDPTYALPVSLLQRRGLLPLSSSSTLSSSSS